MRSGCAALALCCVVRERFIHGEIYKTRPDVVAVVVGETLARAGARAGHPGETQIMNLPE